MSHFGLDLKAFRTFLKRVGSSLVLKRLGEKCKAVCNPVARTTAEIFPSTGERAKEEDLPFADALRATRESSAIEQRFPQPPLFAMSWTSPSSEWTSRTLMWPGFFRAQRRRSAN